ncbi:MAG: T9SS type A sorting domain-containing protein, partial [Bacteroidota bacterium]
AGASFIDSVIYIIGGYHIAQNGNEVSSSTLHRFHVPSNSWMPDGADIPLAIDDHIQGVWRDSLIYVITGWSNVTNVINVQIYNPSTDTWTAGTSVPNSTSYRVFGGSGMIVGDTIWYFGGAQIGSNFPISNRMRRGVINPDDPTQITWTSSVPNFGVVNYRAAAFESQGLLHWIGGSNITYNFDGIAYNGSGGVPPNNQNILFDPVTSTLDTSIQYTYPMDLRGVGKLDDQTVILAGGMETNQEVTNKTWRLDRFQLVSTSLETVKPDELQIDVFPNPASRFLQVRLSTSLSGDWAIFSPSGRRLQSGKISGTSLSVDVSSFSAGMYYLTISSHKGNFYQTFGVAGNN